MTRIESIIFCEGYHDRAFWAGWLLHLQCSDPGIAPGKSERVKVKDPFGEAVTGGQFAYYTPNQHFVRIVHCSGCTEIPRLVRHRLRHHPIECAQSVIINFDEDRDIVTGKLRDQAFRVESFKSLVQSIDPNAIFQSETACRVLQPAVQLLALPWTTPDPHAENLPPLQSLERLVTAAIAECYPQRAAAVAQWLSSRPEIDSKDAIDKAFAWSHMAGWYADHGCEDFYRHLWDDEQIVAALKKRLQQTGAWDIVENLVKT